MEEVMQTLASISCETDSTTEPQTCLCAAPATTESPMAHMLPKRPPPIATECPNATSPPLSPRHCTSPLHSQTPQQHLQPQLQRQPTSPNAESLLVPSLNESRNDQEWVRFPFAADLPFSHPLYYVSTTCNEDGGEWEVSLQPKADDKHGDRASDDLELKTAEIIREARLAAMKQKQMGDPDAARRQQLIQEALARAELRRNSMLTPQSTNTKPANEVDTHESSITKDVDLFRPAGPVPRPFPTLDGRPPMSPTSTTTVPSVTPWQESAARCLSPTESSVGSIDDLESAMNRLPIQIQTEGSDLSREKALRRMDGLLSSPVPPTRQPQPPQHPLAEEDNSIISSASSRHESLFPGTNLQGLTQKKVKKVKTVVIKSTQRRKETEESSILSWFNFLWAGDNAPSHAESDHEAEEYEESLAPMSCSRQRLPLHQPLPTVEASLVRVASGDSIDGDGFVEAISAQELVIDPRMPEWIDNQFATREGLPKDGTYQLGESRTVIVHELIRGSWTWCTAWSPDGRRLAIGTENHHLAVVDTFSSAVWRIKHDKRATGMNKDSDGTHSIRSIAWGAHFIAIGGVGNSISILAPIEPYPILHRINSTGFVGSLDWLKGTNTLLSGSRNGKAMIIKIWAQETDTSTNPVDSGKEIRSTILQTIDRERAWVNVARFSPGGKAVAIGDSKGILGVYGYEEVTRSAVNVTNLANFKLEDSILDIEWSPDGQWLYAGGEDFVVTVINTQWWEAVHRIKRDRWVQFIASSNGGSHVAIGGVSSEVSILDVDRGWDTAINVGLKGLVPLSAKWHPQDQYLVVTGQNNSVLAVETTNARYVSGHFLRSVSPILAIEFSPDGRMAAIGNEAGVVTIFKLSGTTFVTTYELVLDGDGSLAIEWSSNGAFLAVIAGSKVVIIAKSTLRPVSAPPNASGFHVAQVIRDFGLVHDVAISPKCRFLAISGKGKTRFLDASAHFKCVLEVENNGTTLANSWSPDGSWFATIGKNQHLLIYDTSSPKPSHWKLVFTVHTELPGLALAWGPAMLGGLQYCAYGGEEKKVYIMEIRTKERTWETVLAIPREGVIHDLDWNDEGLVAAAIGNGTVTIMDLSYLQSGWAVNEMDYNWQRQALTCFTEIRRNKGKNAMKSVRWIPSAPGSDSLLAVGGTDGEVEIVDLTDRQRCSGFNKLTAPT